MMRVWLPTEGALFRVPDAMLRLVGLRAKVANTTSCAGGKLEHHVSLTRELPSKQDCRNTPAGKSKFFFS